MSTREKRRRAVGLLLVALILTICCTPQFRTFVSFPDHVRLPLGQAQDLAFRLPVEATVHADAGEGLALNGAFLDRAGRRIGLAGPLHIAALQTGQYTVDFRLFGLIPLRRMTVDVVPPIKVVPGGHSIGVTLKSTGVVVVGYAAIRDGDGTLHQPGRDAGLELGDAIVRINGHEVEGEEQAARLFEEAGRSGKPVPMVVRRKGKLVDRQVSPVQDAESRRWRVGLYIRDGAAGVGTLTFYHPASGKYGALGHVIADAETNQAVEFQSGQIAAAEVVRIQKGRRAAPGGKTATQQGRLGSIEKNSRFGIFGTLTNPVSNPYYSQPLPVAMASQVKEGPAEILTVVAGQRIERFQIEIQRVMRQPTAEGKNMVVKVTDPRLLEQTGGIVQGMSGSPILQDGKVVGAVTHVFVNDPTRGYGVLIEWMLHEAGILPASVGERSGGAIVPPGLLARVG